MSLPAEMSEWTAREALQQPIWPDVDAANSVRDQLNRLPPLIFAAEATRLQEQLARVARGEAFLMQAGDCAESFDDFSAAGIRNRLKVILQMSLVLSHATGMPVVKVGRIAGQFAKPRSSPTEMVGGVELPSFRGHIVNSEYPSLEARIPDPQRMLAAYHQSSATLNLLRAFVGGGLADLATLSHLNLDFVAETRHGRRFKAIAEEIERAIEFLTAMGVVSADDIRLRQTELFTSHEALLLDYENALTRRDSISGGWFDCSAHMLWVGERTRHPLGAHVSFLSSVNNPLGAKIGPSATPDDVVGICKRLNPHRIPGRLTLISRMGADQIDLRLPPLVRAVRDSGYPVVWACDPMHGNTTVASNGHKTRHFDTILTEVRKFFAIHYAEGTWPGGLHIELTGDDVTECLGGTQGINESLLPTRYSTLCDPRLNARQSAELAFETALLIRQNKARKTRKQAHKSTAGQSNFGRLALSG